jgi:PAS domain S-box-containing protein
MLKRNPVGMMVEMNDSEAMDVLLSGQLGKGPEGIYELSFKKIPKGICQTIEILLNVGKIFAIGFVFREELFGDAIIITRKGENEKLVKGRSRLIETFMNFASIALQRSLFEKALLKSEKKYHSLFINGSDLLCIHDLEGNLLETNLSYKKKYGLGNENLSGINIRNFIPDRYRAEFDQYLQRIIKNREDDGYLRVINKLGHEVILEYKNKLICDDEGSPIAVHGSARDVTERQKMETALKESEEKYRELVQNANSIIARLDTSGKITFFNEYAEKFFGYTAEEIIGKNALGTIVPDTDTSGNDLSTLVSDIMKNPDLYATYENENILRSGRRVWVSWTNKVISNQNGDIKEILCIGNDITQRKRLENELLQAQKMEALGTMSGGIAHEFNNILGIIIGNTELAIDDVPEWSPAGDCLEDIRTASLRARDVVRQIMSFSRKTPVQRKPIQISTIIQDFLKLMRATIPANIDIRQEILCVNEIILGNSTEINQILMNLCNNSVHAMEGDTGWLKVRLETTVLDDRTAASYGDLQSGEYAKLTIKDCGHGIDPKIKGLIFDPYFTTKDVDKGLGMGLAVVYGIVKKHDGAIRVNSKVDKGTTVEVLFPITKKTAPIEKEVSKGLPRGTERILFVDDEASLVKMVMQMLERQGYEVVGKTSSKEALKLFQKESDKFDLVITDMAMPELPGDRLAQELIKIRPAIPIIICTGHSDRMDEGKALKSGIAAYAMKPLVKKDLVNTVWRVLDKSKGLVR